MLKGAIIGLGNIAVRGHVPAYLSDPALILRMQIVAVMDVVEQSREKAHEHLPGARFYTDLEKMLEHEQLDFVDICTPPHTHAEYIRACAGRGIHVLCEKPLTENTASKEELMPLIRSSGIVFVPCHQYKYSPLWKTIRDIIASGALGVVTLAQFNVFRLQADSGTAAWNPEWRTNKKQSGGGILVDTGAHYFYLAQYFFGVPKNISALLRTLKHEGYGVEDTAIVTLEYERTLMQISLTWAANHRGNSAYIVGTEGTLSYDGRKLHQENASGLTEIPMPDVSDKKQYVAWYAALINEFAMRLETDNTSDDLLCEAGRVMQLLELSYRASEQHKILEVA